MKTKDRPILFSAEMVRAILEGRKTQTRRVIKPQPVKYGDEKAWGLTWGKKCGGGDQWLAKWCPYGSVGDRLWVRETWAPLSEFDPEFGVMYRADNHPSDAVVDFKWTPSIHMPRWASRITLEITGVRVEMLQDISAEDAIAEGAVAPDFEWEHVDSMCRGEFRDLWQSINGPDSWAANPWVWVIEFRRVA